ncbi:L-aspartate oxidase [Pseudalkalibacillus caeni]|uniref:L-aspartate oxidase n=1 Tax=Exobacillus caeni TaxID=2574798 RepID=A0A5R9FC66_9BACL|nr:L-aspartate oxidase [Pseudalkalibacillus caeni]TLS39258.1 L-aspartate oxidase [Pseudalkalibacillus caeni]
MKIRHTEVLIIGSGIAGLMVAELLSMDKNVTIFTKSKMENSNSALAQGGIASVTTEDDHWSNHFFDTIRAGDFHNVEAVTELLIREGTEMVQRLIDLGVPFDRHADGRLALCKEGAHSHNRILHSGGDATGRAIIETLIERVKQSAEIFENEMAVDLLVAEGKCFGAWSLDENRAEVITFADHIILATGGAGKLYSITSNDASITGDGIAMAYRAGAVLSDLEFMQFHPTMLAVNGRGFGLISEAVRGEGAILVDEAGTPIMKGIHAMEDLAPRDIVSRAIYERIRKNDDVYLDVSMISHFEERFPTITKTCRRNGVDPQQGILPVQPGAHFLMGGVQTNRNGQTSIEGLYAIGEVANTGVHGANRLASNSLLEGIVFANRTAATIKSSKWRSVPSRYEERFLSKKVPHLPSVKEIQQTMDVHVGIVRSGPELSKAVDWFETYRSGNEYQGAITHETVVRWNMMTAGWLMASSAMMRTESRGGHFREDYPVRNDKQWKQKRIKRGREWDEPITDQKRSAAIFS